VVDGVAPMTVYVMLPAIVLVAVFVFSVLARRPFWGGVSLALLMVGVLAPQGADGTSRHAVGSWTDYYNSYEDYLAGRWLDEHLASGEKALVTYAFMTATCSHVTSDRLVEFSQLTSASVDELPAELTSRGVEYVVFEYCPMPDKTSSMYPAFAREFPPALLEPFARGREVPGFQHLETLSIPRRAGRADVQIYRVEGVYRRLAP
jgi:hypothetical protein